MATTPASSKIASSSGDGPDTLTLGLAEDAYQGDAQFTVTVDGVLVSATAQTVTASHAAGKEQQFTFTGNWGAGPHSVAVKYLNDAYGGTPATDRNLYLTSAQYDGVAYAGIGKGMYSAGETAGVTVQAPGQGAPSTSTPASPSAPVTVPTPAPVTPAPAAASTSSPSHMSLVGVNLAGPAFGAQNPSSVPGVVGTDYVYPDHGEIDYYASKGMNVFRLSFLMERLEHSQGGALDAAELARIDDVVNYSASKGIKTILDPHNFGAAWGNDIGSSGTPASTLATFWSKLASHYAGNSNVIFGLMNEPHNQTAAQWASMAQDSINAIRGAGATSQEILVPGTYWDNAPDWTKTDNASVVGTQVHDPSHNTAYEVHCYFDPGSGGTAPEAASPTIGVERITEVTKWAEATGNKLFLGEFGASQQAPSLAAMGNMLTYMDQHADAWQGAAYWAAGPWWGADMYSIEPSNRVDKAQMGVLTQHLGMG